MSTVKPPDIDLGQYKFGWHDPANYVFEPKRGLNADVVHDSGLDGTFTVIKEPRQGVSWWQWVLLVIVAAVAGYWIESSHQRGKSSSDKSR